MLWRNVNAKRKFLCVSLVGALLIPVLTLSGVAGATDTQIGVAVCGPDSQGAQISVTQPLNDSVHSQSTVTFRGTVTNASQIEVMIDSDIDRTVAIAANQTTFDLDILFTPGTHTVLLQANDICGAQDATDSVVVTYEPVTQPSSGSTTPTVVQGNQTLDGAPVDTETIEQTESEQILADIPIIGGAVNLVQDIVRNIGLESTVTGNNTTTVAGVARVGITVAALTSVVMASSIAPVVAHAYPSLSRTFHMTGHRYLVYLGWAIRGAGLLAMALAYFI